MSNSLAEHSSSVLDHKHKKVNYCFATLCRYNTILSEGGDKAYKFDEPAAQLQQLNLDRNTQSTTSDKVHQSTEKMQQIYKQKSIADERVEELEKVLAEIENLKNQVSLTRQQLSE